MRHPSSSSRRQVLRGLGLGAVAMPFVPLLERELLAAGAPPRRLLLIVYGNGTYQRSGKNEFFPTGSTFDLTTSTILAPLKDLERKITVIDGLDHTLFQDAAAGGTVGRDHVRAVAQVLTGVGMADKTAADPKMIGGISVDQVVSSDIEKRVKAAGLAAPPFKTINGAVDGDIQGAPQIQAIGVGQRVAATRDVKVQYERLFGGLQLPDGGGDQAAAAALERRQRERNAVLDFVGQRLRAVANVVGSSDRLKIEAHLDHLSTVRARVAQLAAASAGCVKGAISGRGASRFETSLDAQGQMIARAFACDLSRVAVLTAYGVPGSAIGAPEDEHFIAHQAMANTAKFPDAPTFGGKHVRIDTYRMGVIAGILRHLDSVRDGAGTLLDSTLVIVTNDMGGGGHALVRVPTFIAGGGAFGLRTGRHLRVNAVPFNNLHVSICQLMGVPIQTFGAASVCTGAIPGLV